jgi:hypothetical protein
VRRFAGCIPRKISDALLLILLAQILLEILVKRRPFKQTF